MNMSTTARKALEKSIEHWERVVNTPLSEPIGWASCKLCTVFIHGDCDGCPVFARTGIPNCRETPYHEFRRVKVFEQSFPKIPDNKIIDRLRKLANDELQFLISLRETKSETLEEPAECYSGCEDADCPYTHPRL